MVVFAISDNPIGGTRRAPETMKLVIAGGTGLIGTALSADLAADGHDVVVLSRQPEAASPPQGVVVAGWDARSAYGWKHLADGADAVVNLAGESLSRRWTADRKHRIRDSRLNAGRAVVEAIDSARQRPKVLVQASGIGYYGPCSSERVTESSPAGSDFLGRLAVEWEDSTAAVDSLGVRRVIIRTGAVLSTAGGVLPRLLTPFRLFVGGPLAGGRQWFPWIHMIDQVRAIRHLLDDRDASGAFNLVAPESLTNAQFVRILGRVLRRPSLLPVPAFALRLALGEMSSVVIDGQRAVPRRLKQVGFEFRFPDAEQALTDLLSASVSQ